MSYKIMKLICMFDLPVDTPKEQKAYRQFRTRLIKEGFTMMQYSVYIRTCPNREYTHKLERHIKKFVPQAGNIRLLTITEKQYNDMILLVGSKSQTERVIGDQRMIII